MAQTVDVLLPDIGDFDQVDVIEVLVSAGDSVEAEDSLITLESEKSTMEIPAPQGGVVKEVLVSVGDKIGQAARIAVMEVSEVVKQEAVAEPEPIVEPEKIVQEQVPVAPTSPPTRENAPVVERRSHARSGSAYAGPAVRRFARDLGVDLSRVVGTGRKGRVVKEDVQTFVKSVMKGAQPAANAFRPPEMPRIDFSKFGEIESRPLSKIKKFTGLNLHRSWITVPHVTQFDEADITELEAYRKTNKEAAAAEGVKLTPLAFMLKACVVALQATPEFNASLSQDGEELILKKYFHIGVAVDTPNGLVVPVIRDVDKKSLFDVARELIALSGKARDNKLLPKDMQGGCFSISSLGGIGGTAFTPIVNAPEVAILGVSRSQMKPVYQDGEFVPRLILPFSISYDHRVIDGAAAARFTTLLASVLADVDQMIGEGE